MDKLFAPPGWTAAELAGVAALATLCYRVVTYAWSRIVK